jgi:hypothetical protein
MARARAGLLPGGLAAALLLLAGALLTAALGSDLERHPCPARIDMAAPPAPAKAPAKSRDITYDPWELVSV